VFAFDATRNYRESYGIFAVNGIMFNHESPRRGETFVTRKITRAVARIMAGQQECLYLGNLAARRDWGYAADYVEAMWRMMQADVPDDYVIATGESHSVRDFCELAFKLGGRPITWRGSGIDEVGVDGDGKTIVKIDPRYFRPAEVDEMRGDASYAREKLGWAPKVSFEELVRIMLEADRELVRKSAR
jgi:GDPmannose 4,6-dehydratase